MKKNEFFKFFSKWVTLFPVPLMFSILSLIFAVVVCVLMISCDNPQGKSYLVGEWVYTGQVAGIPDILIMNLSIESDETYSIVGVITDGVNSITALTESGIWDKSGNKITFSPASCQMYNVETYSLESSECDPPVIYVIDGNEMTNGSYVFTKE